MRVNLKFFESLRLREGKNDETNTNFHKPAGFSQAGRIPSGRHYLSIVLYFRPSRHKTSRMTQCRRTDRSTIFPIRLISSGIEWACRNWVRRWPDPRATIKRPSSTSSSERPSRIIWHPLALWIPALEWLQMSGNGTIWPASEICRS